MKTELYLSLILLLLEVEASMVSESFNFKHIPGCEKNFALLGNVSVSQNARSKLDCARSCSLHPDCLGFNLCKTESSTVPRLCQLVTQWSHDSCEILTPAPECSYSQLVSGIFVLCVVNCLTNPKTNLD